MCFSARAAELREFRETHRIAHAARAQLEEHVLAAFLEAHALAFRRAAFDLAGVDEAEQRPRAVEDERRPRRLSADHQRLLDLAGRTQAGPAQALRRV